MKKGILITIEGIHGAGKSVISERIAGKLEELELEVVLGVDQGDTDIASAVSNK